MPSHHPTLSHRARVALWGRHRAFYSAIIVSGLVLSLASVERSSAARGALQTNEVAIVSAGSFETPVSPGSIIAIFGADLATANESASTLPLPTVLAGTSVTVTDSNGTNRPASLFFVSPGQVNCQIPPGTASGTATVRVLSGSGAMSTGTVEVIGATPAIFTANVSGQGVPAANLIRVKPDMSQTVESAFQGEFPNFIPRPIDLGPEGEQVFLILYLTGLGGLPDSDGNAGNGSAENVRVLLGGVEVTPTFAGPAPNFIGLEQINVPIPRELIARGGVGVSVTALGFITSREVEIEIAPPSGLPVIEVTGVGASSPVLARDLITIDGNNLPVDPADMTVRVGGVEAGVEAASPTQLSVRVPFGVASGPVSINTTTSNWMSDTTLPVRTSVSGHIRDTRDQPLSGVRVRLPNNSVMTESTPGGWFVLPDTPPSSALAFAVDPPTESTVPLPSVILKMPVAGQRDNPYPESIYLQPTTGPALPVGTPPTAGPAGTSAARGRGASPQQEGGNPSITTGGVTFRLPAFGVSATFPGGETSGDIVLDLVENSLTPVRLPRGVFSSAIIQLTPFGVKLDPGGQLVFPNTDDLPAGTAVRLYSFELDRTSPDFGTFVDRGLRAMVSADGTRIETEESAITETTYYFVALPRPLTTIVGRVLDSDGNHPVRNAVIRARGQHALSDGNGGFVLRDVPTLGNETIAVQASKLRPSGRVDRALGETEPSVVGGLTRIAALRIGSPNDNRPPFIYAPTVINIYTGQTKDALFGVADLDEGQRVTNVVVEGADYATVESTSTNNFYRLRLAPTLRDLGERKLTITATDTAGGMRAHTINVTVKPLPVAVARSITTNEDQQVEISLQGIDIDNRPLKFTLKENVRNGQLSGTPPVVTYTPQLNFNGTDSFTYAVDNGLVEGPAATVTITVNPVNDPPMLNLPVQVQTMIGQTVNFNVSASDPDAGQTATLAALILPLGAQFNVVTGNFSWTPSAAQIGSHSATFRATDNGQPPLSTTRTVNIIVNGPGVWVAMNGPDGGTINALLNNGGAILAGSESAGIFRSTNGGSSWGAANGGLDSLDVRALTVFAGFVFAGTDGGIFRSEDGGANWSPINTGLGNTDVRALAVVGNTLLAGTAGGVFRFTGTAWTEANNGLKNLDVRALAVVSEVLYAGTHGDGVYRSTNLGGSWGPFNTGLGTPLILSLAVRQVPGVASILYAGTDGFGVYATSSASANWTPLSNGLGAVVVNALAAGGNLLFAATEGRGVYRFNFASPAGIWVQINNGLNNLFVRSLLIGPNTIFAGTREGGIYRSNDIGESWEAVNQGLPRARVTDLAAHGGMLFAATNGGGVYVREGAESGWKTMSAGLTSPVVSSLASAGGNLFAGTLGGGVFRLVNDGKTWTPINRGISNLQIRSLMARQNLIFAGSGGGGIFRSEDAGANWTPVNSGLSNDDVFVLAADSGILFAGMHGSGIFRSEDAGTNWKAANNGLTDADINALLIVDGVVYAGTEGGGVFRSKDNGETWTEVNEGLGNLNVRSLATTGGAIFAATDGGGIFVMVNGEDKWTEANNGLTNLRVLSLLVIGDALFAGTDGGGVFLLR